MWELSDTTHHGMPFITKDISPTSTIILLILLFDSLCYTSNVSLEESLVVIDRNIILSKNHSTISLCSACFQQFITHQFVDHQSPTQTLKICCKNITLLGRLTPYMVKVSAWFYTHTHTHPACFQCAVKCDVYSKLSVVLINRITTNIKLSTPFNMGTPYMPRIMYCFHPLTVLR